MSSDQMSDCCITIPRIVPQGYERVGTTKKTEKGLNYYESAQNVTNHDLAVVVVYDVSSASGRRMLSVKDH